MRKYILILTFLPFAVGARTQSTRPVTYEPRGQTGMSAERLRLLDTVLQQAVDNKWAPGMEALVIRGGKVAYHKVFGSDDPASGKKLEMNAIYRVASQTKAITSVAVMILYEQGKLLLDDPVSKYIPAFRNPKILDVYHPSDTSYSVIPAKKEITIRHLLTHTSGLGYSQIGDGALNEIYCKHRIPCGLGSQHRSLSEVMNELGTLPLAHEPGERFTYGLNVDVLGYIVERVSGISLDAFFKRYIFGPLDMRDTYFYLPKEKYKRLVNLYIVDDSGVLVKSPGYFETSGSVLKDYPATEGSYYSGGAGLVSTITDYAHFLQMLLDGGAYNGKRILSSTSVRLMTMNQIGPLLCHSQKFGLGFLVISAEGSALTPQSEGTFGWGGAFSTVYWVDPRKKIIGLLYRQMWNDQHEEELNGKFKALVYQAVTE
ncbi:MAG: hypothetical protein BGO55_04560 [Sphingobacteriales bacterium 50-39]|nr:beta-lactamase family protein [Sphingobacteriales bacterium]OJW55894.1 MAG: hypothetical protein BGO55_04560 [Sphingobacteriales bacterium 50-39]